MSGDADSLSNAPGSNVTRVGNLDHGYTTVTLNRAERLDSLCSDLFRLFGKALNAVAADGSMMRRGLSMDLETSPKMTAAVEAIKLSSDDHLDSMDAVRQKLRPEFKGN